VAQLSYVLTLIRSAVIGFNLKLNGHYLQATEQIVEYCDPIPPDKILDIGGGNGKIGSIIGQKTGVPVIVAEPDKSMIEIGWQSKSQVEFIQAAGESLPFYDGGFSLILLVHVLHHTKNFDTVISEASRVLKIGGMIFIEELSHKCSPWQRLWRRLESLVCGALTIIPANRLVATLEREGISPEFACDASGAILVVGVKSPGVETGDKDNG
jgi:2-polyprenyl-3-methyl-5-hydroxy-6-metoxy-1,4-benzoquinol methylase